MTSCPKCHHDLTTGASFCASCGTPIVAAQAQGEPRDPFIGQTFKDTYFVEMRIGGGGMGDVYRARHVTLDAPVALKILKRSLLSDPSIVQRFQREARAASRLRHPSVIHVTDFGQTEDGTLYMAMEYVAGKSLARVITDEAPLSDRRVVHIGQQVLSALAEAHANQILHRDLKPENVMLESRRNDADAVKVLDFGIAKIQEPGGEGKTLTQPGLVCGTPGYMSPEQWNGEELDARSDLYSVGVILYEMLTGKLPFEAQTPMEMMRKHLTESVVPPSARRERGGVSPDLEALVMRALSPRHGRPASAEEMRDALLGCVLLPEAACLPSDAEARGTVLIPPGNSPRTPAPTVPMKTPGSMPGGAIGAAPAAPPRRSRTLLVAGAVAGAIALVCGGAYLAVHTRDARRAEAAKRSEEDARRRADEESRKRASQDEARERGEAEARQVEESRKRAEEEQRRLDAEARLRAEEERRRRPSKERHRPRDGQFESRAKLYSFPLPPATDGKGVLSINAEPPGGTVLVDGVAYGTAPREVLVPAGRYDVRVTVRSGEQSKRITVRAGTREAWTAIFRAD